MQVAALGRYAAHIAAFDQDRAFVGFVEPGDHAKQRGLAAARGPEQSEELARLDAHADVVHGGEIAEAARHAAQFQ